MLPRIAWPGLHIPVYRHDHSATLAEVLTSLSPVLGGLPGQGTDARHGKHSHSFLTPTSFFLVAYVFILVGLAFKISIRKTAAWRQIALPFSFGIARTIYWSLRSARLAKQPDNPAVHDVHSVVKEDFTMAFWVEQGFLLTASGALVSGSSSRLAGEVRSGLTFSARPALPAVPDHDALPRRGSQSPHPELHLTLATETLGRARQGKDRSRHTAAFITSADTDSSQSSHWPSALPWDSQFHHSWLARCDISRKTPPNGPTG